VAVVCGVIAGLAGVAAFGGFAFTSGWAAANRAGNATINHVAPEPIIVAVPEYGQRSGVLMPDVRGLTEQDARQALADAGVPGEIVTAEQRPAAGRAGVVIQQAPVQGASIDSTAQVLLVVSTPAVVPAVVGRSPAEGAAELMGMGVRVVQKRVYEPGATLGRIVSTEPEAGSELPEEITFNVADSPAELQLSDKNTTAGSFSAHADVEVAGRTFSRSIDITGRLEPSVATWTLAGNGVELTGSVVLDDYADEEEQALLQILGDGRELYRGLVNSKTPVALPTTDLTGVQALSVVVTAVATEDSSSYHSVSISLLDLKVLGSYDQIAAIR
jgi:hypothetical protein